MEARANAARALGILRSKAAVPDLVAALRSKDKDTDVIFESLIALQKIRDESAAPGVAFLLRDLDQKVQLAAIETVGLLQNQSSVPQLQAVRPFTTTMILCALVRVRPPECRCPKQPFWHPKRPPIAGRPRPPMQDRLREIPSAWRAL